MGWFSGETDLERQQREMAQALQEQAQKQARAAEEFSASPRGRAQKAVQRGDGWLRVELPIWRLEQERGFFLGVNESQDELTSQDAYAATIAEVETEGWELFSTSSAYVTTRVDVPSGGGAAAVSGHLVDVLTFRRVRTPLG